MDRIIDGQLTGDYLTAQGIVPTVKVDQGLADEVDSVQLMKPLTKLEPLLAGALERSMFGTKMRSVIKSANPAGIQAIGDQQFAVMAQILANGLVPILEPEVNVYAPTKARPKLSSETMCWQSLDELPTDPPVVVTLSIPTVPLHLLHEGDATANNKTRRKTAGMDRENDRCKLCQAGKTA